MNTVREICDALGAADTLTIFMHRRPDGDTVGSAAALGLALKGLGKRVFFACADPITPRYAPLLFGGLCREPKGLTVAVDIAAPDMAGEWQDEVAAADIVIDHHGTNPLYGKLNLVKADAAACGEIVFDVVRTLTDITPKIAEALYTAIATDTGCFLHGNTTPTTHRIAAKLMEYELDVSALNRKLFVIKSKACLAVRSRLTDSADISTEGFATLVLRLKDIEELGAAEDDLENIAGLGMNIEGVRAAATLRQTAEGEYKVSLRSDGSVDAAAVCRGFSGGGHKMAAGCTLYGTEAECRAQILKAMKEA